MSQRSGGLPNILGLVRATSLKVLGKPGAEAGAGLAGGTTSGAPTAGAFEVGDAVVAQNGHLWICTIAGSPGTWVDAGAAGGYTDPLTTRGDLVVRGAASTGRLALGSSGQYLTSDGTDALWGTPASGLYSAYINIQDQKPQNTAGGTATSGAWRTRDLNTEVADTGNHASVASNQITLAAGTYRADIRAPVLNCGRHQIRLQNITDSSTIAYGSSEYATTSTNGVNDSVLRTRFTLAAQKVLEVQHQVQITQATEGFGVEANFGTEVYTVVELFRE